MAIDLNDLLNKQNNPDNTALQDYGPEYVITADEWVKTVQAIQQNQNSVKKVSYNSREYLPDEEGLVTIIDASEGDVIFSAITMVNEDGSPASISQNYGRNSKEVYLYFKHEYTVNGMEDVSWTIKYIVTKNYTSAGAEPITLGNYTNVTSNSETIHKSINLANYLTNSAGVVDRIVIQVYNEGGGIVGSRTVYFTCTYAVVSLHSSFNFAEINKNEIEYLTTFQGATNANLVTQYRGQYDTEWKDLNIMQVVSNSSAKVVDISGIRQDTDFNGGIYVVRAFLSLNNDNFQSAPLDTEVVLIVPAVQDTNFVIVEPIVDAVQYEDATVNFTVYSANNSTAEVQITVLNAEGTIVSQTAIESSSATLNSVGVKASYTFSVPSTSTTIRFKVGNYTRNYTFKAQGSDITWKITEKELALFLNAKGKSNTDIGCSSWVYNEYTTSFYNVDFGASNGWFNSQSLRLTSGRAEINFYPFYDETPYNSQKQGGGILATGRTLSIKFKTSNVSNKGAKVIHCDDGNIGFYIRPDSFFARLGTALLDDYNADQASSTNNRRFNADEDIEFTISIQPLFEGGVRRGQGSEIHIYINGEIAAVQNLTTFNTLSQNTPLPITLQGEGCTLDVYYVRSYNRCLTGDEIYQNYVMSKTNAIEMEQDFAKNNYIFDHTAECLNEGIAYCKAQSLKPNGNCSIIVTTDLRSGVTSTSATTKKLDELWLLFFKDGDYDYDRTVKYVSNEPGAVRVRVQGTSTAAMPKKNLRYDAKGSITKYKLDPLTQEWYIVEADLRKLDIKLYNTSERAQLEEGNDVALPCTLLTTKTNYNESTATRNLPNALWVEDAIKYLGSLSDYADILTPPQRANSKVRQAIDGQPALQYFFDKFDSKMTSFTGKVDLITDKANMSVFGFDYNTSQHDTYSIELRNNDSDVCNFKTSDLSRSCQYLEDSTQAGDDDFEFRYPDAQTRYNSNGLNKDLDEVADTNFIGPNSTIQKLYDFVYNCSLDRPVNTQSNNGQIIEVESISIQGSIPYYLDDEGNRVYTVDRQKDKNLLYTTVNWNVEDTIHNRKLKFFAEAHKYIVVNSFVFNGLVSYTHLWTDQRAKNQFFTHYNGDVDPESGNQVLRLLPYDIDTSWRSDNNSRLRYDYTRRYSDPGIYDDRQSMLYQLLDGCFQIKYEQMYQILCNAGFYSLNTLQKYYKDNQAEAYSSIIYNADSEYKYLATASEGGTATNQRFKAHGSAIEDLDWWMKGRLYFIGGQYYTVQDKTSEYATKSITIDLRPNTELGNPTLQMSSYERNYLNFLLGTQYLTDAYCEENQSTEVTIPIQSTGNESRLIVYGFNQVKSFGDLSKLYVNNISSSFTLNVQDLIIGNTDSQYENDVFTGFGSATYGACKYVNVANCTKYENADFSRFPTLEELIMTGCTSVQAVTLPDGASIKKLYLPANLQELVLEDKVNLEEIEIEGTDQLNYIVMKNCSNITLDFIFEILNKIYE